VLVHEAQDEFYGDRLGTVLKEMGG